MSAERDELARLIQEIPDEDVPVVLAEVRRHLVPPAERPWPPAFFASFASGRSDLATNCDEILAEGFGRSQMIVCDTGPLVGAADRDEVHHRSCTDLFTGLHLAGRALLVPAPVVAEVGFLLARGAGATVESAFLRSIVDGTLTVVDLQVQDYARMAELVEIYADFPLGTTDAAVVAVAERLGVVELATLDHRHFRAVRPRHVDAFSLLPQRASRSAEAIYPRT